MGFGGAFNQSFGGTGSGGGTTLRYLVRRSYEAFITIRKRVASYILTRKKYEVKL